MKLNKNIFIVIFFIFIFLNLLSNQDSDITLNENRGKTNAPRFSLTSFLDGSFANQTELYFEDNFIFRSKFIDIGNRISNMFGISGNEIGIYAQTGANIAQSHMNNDDIENIREEIVGQILVIENKGMEINHWNEKASKSYADALNFFSKNINSQINLYSMIIPTQIEFVDSNYAKSISYSQKKSIDFVSELMDPKINIIDAYEKLKNNHEKNIYFKTDHHWTSLGAYYGYSAFMESKGIYPFSLDELNRYDFGEFLGTTYSSTLNLNLKNNPDELVAYAPNLPYDFNIYYSNDEFIDGFIINEYLGSKDTNQYGVFLGGDFPLGVIKTENNTNKKIAVIKDSYANTFVPYLVAHYKEIFIIDPRQFEENIIDLIEREAIDDVLFLNYALVNRFEGYGDILLKNFNREN